MLYKESRFFESLVKQNLFLLLLSHTRFFFSVPLFLLPSHTSNLLYIYRSHRTYVTPALTTLSTLDSHPHPCFQQLCLYSHGLLSNFITNPLSNFTCLHAALKVSICVWVRILNLYLSDWVISPNAIISSLIFSFKNFTTLFFCSSWVNFHRVYTPHFHYPRD